MLHFEYTEDTRMKEMITKVNEDAMQKAIASRVPLCSTPTLMWLSTDVLQYMAMLERGGLYTGLRFILPVCCATLTGNHDKSCYLQNGYTCGQCIQTRVVHAFV